MSGTPADANTRRRSMNPFDTAGRSNSAQPLSEGIEATETRMELIKTQAQLSKALEDIKSKNRTIDELLQELEALQADMEPLKAGLANISLLEEEKRKNHNLEAQLKAEKESLRTQHKNTQAELEFLKQKLDDQARQHQETLQQLQQQHQQQLQQQQQQLKRDYDSQIDALQQQLQQLQRQQQQQQQLQQEPVFAFATESISKQNSSEPEKSRMTLPTAPTNVKPAFSHVNNAAAHGHTQQQAQSHSRQVVTKNSDDASTGIRRLGSVEASRNDHAAHAAANPPTESAAIANARAVFAKSASKEDPKKGMKRMSSSPSVSASVSPQKPLGQSRQTSSGSDDVKERRLSAVVVEENPLPSEGKTQAFMAKFAGTPAGTPANDNNSMRTTRSATVTSSSRPKSGIKKRESQPVVQQTEQPKTAFAQVAKPAFNPMVVPKAGAQQQQQQQQHQQRTSIHRQSSLQPTVAHAPAQNAIQRQPSSESFAQSAPNPAPVQTEASIYEASNLPASNKAKAFQDKLAAEAAEAQAMRPTRSATLTSKPATVVIKGAQQGCGVCGQAVYQMEKLETDGVVYHKYCFKCEVCKKAVSLQGFAALEGKVYCKPHFKQLFALKGNYNEGFGTEQHKNKWNYTPQAGSTEV